MSNSLAVLAIVSLTLFSACSKKEDTPPASTTTNFTATINGAQQVPAVTSTATGEFLGA